MAVSRVLQAVLSGVLLMKSRSSSEREILCDGLCRRWFGLLGIELSGCEPYITVIVVSGGLRHPIAGQNRYQYFTPKLRDEEIKTVE